MHKVTSADGTAIAFDRLGDGPPIILVAGATCARGMTRPLADALAPHATVINVDRRGRGDSGDTAPYAVEREIEDLEALVAEAGGSATLYGHSSGAALVLHAVARGLPVDGYVLHEPPFSPPGEERTREAREYAETLTALLAENRRGDAVELFMTLVGLPPETIAGMRQSPMWPGLEAVAPTLAYDSEIMGNVVRGGAVPFEVIADITTPVPALVVAGGASPAWMVETGRRVVDVLPNAELRVLEGQGHGVAPELLAPVLARFVGAYRGVAS